MHGGLVPSHLWFPFLYAPHSSWSECLPPWSWNTPGRTSVDACWFCLKYRYFPQAHEDFSPYLCQLKSISPSETTVSDSCSPAALTTGKQQPHLLLAEHPGAHFLLLPTVGLAAPEALIPWMQELRNAQSAYLLPVRETFSCSSAGLFQKAQLEAWILELAQASGFDIKVDRNSH